MNNRLAALLVAGAVLTSGCAMRENRAATTVFSAPGGTAAWSSTETAVRSPDVVISAPGFFYSTSDVSYDRRWYGDRHPYAWRYAKPRRWDRGYEDAGRPVAPQWRPGEPRYVIPGKDLRCDNVLRACYRWSGRQGRYDWDKGESRALYGLPGSHRPKIPRTHTPYLTR